MSCLKPFYPEKNILNTFWYRSHLAYSRKPISTCFIESLMKRELTANAFQLEKYIPVFVQDFLKEAMCLACRSRLLYFITFYGMFSSYFMPGVQNELAPGNFYRRRSMRGNSLRREATPEEIIPFLAFPLLVRFVFFELKHKSTENSSRFMNKNFHIRCRCFSY